MYDHKDSNPMKMARTLLWMERAESKREKERETAVLDPP